MTWQDPPQHGESWSCRRLYSGRQIVQRQETRRVVDRTLGGDVIFVSSLDRYKYRQQCTEAEWIAWVAASLARKTS